MGPSTIVVYLALWDEQSGPRVFARIEVTGSVLPFLPQGVSIAVVVNRVAIIVNGFEPLSDRVNVESGQKDEEKHRDAYYSPCGRLVPKLLYRQFNDCPSLPVQGGPDCG